MPADITIIQIQSIRSQMLHAVAHRLGDIVTLREAIQTGALPGHNDELAEALVKLGDVTQLCRSVETLLGHALDSHRERCDQEAAELKAQLDGLQPLT